MAVKDMRMKWFREAFVARRSNPPTPSLEMGRIDRVLYDLGEEAMVSCTRHRLEVDISILSPGQRRTLLAGLVKHNAPGQIFAAGDGAVTWITFTNPGGERLHDVLWNRVIPAVECCLMAATRPVGAGAG